MVILFVMEVGCKGFQFVSVEGILYVWNGVDSVYDYSY